MIFSFDYQCMKIDEYSTVKAAIHLTAWWIKKIAILHVKGG